MMRLLATLGVRWVMTPSPGDQEYAEWSTLGFLMIIIRPPLAMIYARLHPSGPQIWADQAKALRGKNEGVFGILHTVHACLLQPFPPVIYCILLVTLQGV